MNQQIVNLRGIAIILVMLGHSIIIYDSRFNLFHSDIQMPLFETIKHLISFVQMKLFISISGFLLAYKCLKDKTIHSYRNFIFDKIKRLLIPYLVVCLVYNDPLKYVLHIEGYYNPLIFITEQLLGTNCAHLWYLPCLFIIMLVAYPLFCWARKNVFRHAILLTLFLILNYKYSSIPVYYQLSNTAYYLLFFHIGYLINLLRICDAKFIVKAKKSKFCLFVWLLAFIVGYIIYQLTSIGYEAYLSIAILCLIYTYFPSSKSNLINEISRRSYGLYLFHSPLVYITATFCPNINPWLMLFVNFICFGGVAYLFTLLLSKSRLKFIIGE